MEKKKKKKKINLQLGFGLEPCVQGILQGAETSAGNTDLTDGKVQELTKMS